MKTQNNYFAAVSAPVPQATKSYKPVSNIELISEIREAIDRNGLAVKSEGYEMNGHNSQLFGVMTINAPDSEMDMNIGFRNSYDKSLPVGLCAGATVIVCSNLMFKGEIKRVRKHTTNVMRDLRPLIAEVVEYCGNQFADLKRDSERMNAAELSHRQMAEIAGRLFIEDEILNATQIGIVKKEIQFSQTFTESTLWTLYNHLTEAFKIEHPSTRMNKHIRAHDYCLELIS
jgi:hypothetical protein